jgi:LacI family transcriptional regulator
MQKLLTVRPRPDGVVCYNDPTAAGALRAAIAAGLRVPEDIAIIGAGNVHYSDFLRVPLSTVDQHSTSIGESAANLLLEIIQAKTAPKPRAVLLEPTVVARDSSRKSPAIG